MLENNHYQTTDTAFVTYLITEGFIPIEIDYSGERYVYKFQETHTEILPYAQKYESTEASVEPVNYNRIYRKLLRLVKNKLQWYGA